MAAPRKYLRDTPFYFEPDKLPQLMTTIILFIVLVATSGWGGTDSHSSLEVRSGQGPYSINYLRNHHMWMTDYIDAIRRGLRDQHDLVPTGGTDDAPLFDAIPDGEYPMTIDGKLDNVRIENGCFNCCNFADETA